jgi:hypothetical protein
MHGDGAPASEALEFSVRERVRVDDERAAAKAPRVLEDFERGPPGHR